MTGKLLLLTRGHIVYVKARGVGERTRVRQESHLLGNWATTHACPLGFQKQILELSVQTVTKYTVNSNFFAFSEECVGVHGHRIIWGWPGEGLFREISILHENWDQVGCQGLAFSVAEPHRGYSWERPPELLST